MLPFLVNMARLYKLFVAEWLKAHQVHDLLPHHLEVKSQHQVHISVKQCFANRIKTWEEPN
jgi:5-methylcytosine-specific restriction enzyme subunit McrC